MPGTRYPKQQMHRIAYAKITPQQIAAKLGPAAAAGPVSAAPLSDVYAGKALRIVTDTSDRGAGPTLEYRFKDARKLMVSENGGKAVEVGYGAQAEAASLCVDPRGGLHQAVSRVSADHVAAPDQISLAADGRSASGRYSCLVETETPRHLDCTLAQMAHAQGEGMIRSAERRVLLARYVKAERGWVIETLRLEPV